MRPALVVVAPPGLDQHLRFLDRGEPVDVQALVPERSVEGLDVRVVGRLAGTGEVDPRSMMIRPQVDRMTGELGAVVGE